jgi:hypothetical protein
MTLDPLPYDHDQNVLLDLIVTMCVLVFCLFTLLKALKGPYR